MLSSAGTRLSRERGRQTSNRIITVRRQILRHGSSRNPPFLGVCRLLPTQDKVHLLRRLANGPCSAPSTESLQMPLPSQRYDEPRHWSGDTSSVWNETDFASPARSDPFSPPPRTRALRVELLWIMERDQYACRKDGLRYSRGTQTRKNVPQGKARIRNGTVV